MNQPQDDEQKEKSLKKRNQIIFVASSFGALVIVGIIAFVGLSKIKALKELSGDESGLSQDQFEGAAEISSQLQAECQNSANKLSKLQDATAMAQEYRQLGENCKDVYITLENAGNFRKEGMYADLVVDIAKEISKADKSKAVELLTFARNFKSWDFYLGPVSCDSQHVLDAYIESYALSEGKTCFTKDDIKSKIACEVSSKNFSFLSKMVSQNEVVWLGMPESDVGCPEKVSSVVEVLKKLTPGAITLDTSAAEPNENNQLNLNIKLSDKENITLVMGAGEQCLSLNSVLVPNLEVSE